MPVRAAAVATWRPIQTRSRQECLHIAAFKARRQMGTGGADLHILRAETRRLVGTSKCDINGAV